MPPAGVQQDASTRSLTLCKRLYAWHHVAMDQVRVGTFTRSLLLRIAGTAGYLADAGLEVSETSVRSSPEQFSSLLAGEFDLVFTSPDNVLAYRFLTANPLGHNFDVEILAGIDRGFGLSLCLAPGLDSAAAVRGKKLGVDVPSSGFSFVAFALLDQAGVQPGDYVIESLGSTPRRVAALTSAQCAATILNASNELVAQQAGCRIHAQVTAVGPYLGTVTAALRTTDPATTALRERFTQAILATSRDILSGQHSDDIITAAEELLNLSPSQAKAHYETVLDPQHGLVSGGMVDRASLQTLVDLRRRFAPTAELDTIMESAPSFIPEALLH